MDHESDSIEVGKNADLLLLDSNPLDQIKNIEKINNVIKGTFVICLSSLFIHFQPLANL